MPSAHATLGPSSSSRWIACPASIGMSEKVPRPPESPYAHEGTLAHALAELEARHHFGQSTLAERDLEYEAWRAAANLTVDEIGEMALHVRGYIALIEERKARYPFTQVLFEQRVETGVDKCWGTSDTILVSPQHVEIIDFKYGMGVPVDAEGNSQLRLYGLGALEMFDGLVGDIDEVFCSVYQPRIGNVSTEAISAAELRAWREAVVRPAAVEALSSPRPSFGPSESACRWCPAAGDCRVRMERMAAADFMDTEADPDLISPEELGDLLGKLTEMRDFCDAVGAAALRRAYSGGETIPGWKVVRSAGRRSIPDGTAAIQTFIDAGYNAEQVATFKVKPLGALEKLVGKKELPDLLGDLLVKSEGSPSIVPADDKRESINPEGDAAADFSE